MNPLVVRGALTTGACALLAQVIAVLLLDDAAEADGLNLMRGPALEIADAVADTPPPGRRALAERLQKRCGYPVDFRDRRATESPVVEWERGELL